MSKPEDKTYLQLNNELLQDVMNCSESLADLDVSPSNRRFQETAKSKLFEVIAKAQNIINNIS